MARAHVEHIHAPQIEVQPLWWPGWPGGAQVKLLSEDDVSGALTSLMLLPEGYARPAGRLHSDQELLVLSGSLAVGDVTMDRLTYRYVAPEMSEARWDVLEDAELLYMTRSGKPDLFTGNELTDGAGVLHIASAELPWKAVPFPGGPPGVEVALLRIDPVSAEVSMLARGNGPRTHHHWEYHDCTEEAYMIEGDITIGPGGLMSPGTYFWRPPYYTHGWSSSETTSLLYVHTGGQLINHYADSADRTPEENRAEWETQALRQLRAARAALLA